MSKFEVVVVRLLLMIANRVGQVPGVARYEDDEEFLEEVEKELDAND